MRKRNTAIITILVLPFILAAHPVFSYEEKQGVPVCLTLEKSIEIAYLNNKDIQIQEKEIQASLARIVGAQSEFLPKIDLEGGYTYNDAVDDPMSVYDTRRHSGVSQGYRNDNKWDITVSETIYKGGANAANYKQASLDLKVQRETLRATKLDVEFEAKRLYYGLQLAYDTERIKRNLVTQAEAHYDDVTNKFQQGTASRFDVLQSKVHVAKTIPGLVRAVNDIEVIKADFKKLLSLDMRDDIKIDRYLSYAPLVIAEGEFLDRAYAGKPEMVLKTLGVDIKKWAIAKAQAGNLPTVDANASFGYRSDNPGKMLMASHNDWTAGFSVRVPIYDGLSARAKVDEARAQYARANLSKEDLIEQIAVDIRRGCLNVKEAQAIITSQEDNLVEAKEALRLSEVGYDAGVNTNLDVLDAQVSLSDVEENLCRGIYDYLMAEAFLARTMGEEYLRRR